MRNIVDDYEKFNRGVKALGEVSDVRKAYKTDYMNTIDKYLNSTEIVNYSDFENAITNQYEIFKSLDGDYLDKFSKNILGRTIDFFNIIIDTCLIN